MSETMTSHEIKDYRRKFNMSQAQFAHFLGVGVASLKRWEADETPINKSLSQLITLRCNYEIAEGNLNVIRELLRIRDL